MAGAADQMGPPDPDAEELAQLLSHPSQNKWIQLFSGKNDEERLAIFAKYGWQITRETEEVGWDEETDKPETVTRTSYKYYGEDLSSWHFQNWFEEMDLLYNLG